MAYTVDEKRLAVARHLINGESLREVARSLEISPTSLITWVKDFNAGNLGDAKDLSKVLPDRPEVGLQMASCAPPTPGDLSAPKRLYIQLKAGDWYYLDMARVTRYHLSN